MSDENGIKTAEDKKETKVLKKAAVKKRLDAAIADVKGFVGAKADDAAVIIKKGGAFAVQKAGDSAADLQKQILKPVFKKDMLTGELPDMICICEPDKAHKDSSVCKGAVGHYTVAKEMTILNLYASSASDFDLKFYPGLSEDVYYRHPFDANQYISFDEYFYQLKKEKVDELLKIAQSLGAKYVKITLMAEKKSFTGSSLKAQAKIPGMKKGKDPFSGSVNAEVSNKILQTVEVSAETKFKGHRPTLPDLQYFSNEHDIQTLINMRLNEPNDIREQTYMIKFSNSSKIKAQAAAKIDAALKKMKLLNGNASISAEIEDESRLYYEYHIEFPD